MYVRIKLEDKVYYSYVFLEFNYDYMPHVVVYDPYLDNFAIVSNLSMKSYGVRQVGYMNENEKDFIYKQTLTINKGEIHKCKGYPWLINNVDLINEIVKGNKIDEEYVKLAKEMNATIDPDAWNNVETEEDASEFMYQVGAFHDTYLIGMEAEASYLYCDEPAKFRLKFHSPGAFDILVEFIDAINVNYHLTSCNRIYLSSIVFKDDLIYWVDGDEDLGPNDINGYNYIYGKKLRWKYIIKN